MEQHSSQHKAQHSARRITIQVSQETLRALEKEASAAGASVSSFARQLLDSGLRQKRRSDLERRLREGYRALAEEHRSLAREMDAARSREE